MSNKSERKKTGSALFKKGFRNLGRILINGGASVAIGAAKNTPIGGVLDEIGVFDVIKDELGMEDKPSAEVAPRIEELSPEQLNSLERITEMETNAEIAQIEADLGKVTEHSSRISEVNETIRAEVIANPEAGKWRPVWGLWSCYGFWTITGLIVAILGYSVVVGDWEIVAEIPKIISAFAALMILPASILGVASFHRGIEKRILAGEERK